MSDISRSVHHINCDAALAALLRPAARNFPENFGKFDQSFFIKTRKELKLELYKLIDSIEDEELLQELSEDVVPYMIASRHEAAEDDDLTEEQEKELREAIAEADRGETISFEEFKKSTDRWRTALKSTKGLG